MFDREDFRSFDRNRSPGDRMTRAATIRRLLAAAAFIAALVGCSSKSLYEFDQMDLTSAEEELTEFSLGHYAIPIPIIGSEGPSAGVRHNRLEFAFDLHALVPHEEEAHMAELWGQHEGKVRDRVLRICRGASAEELEEQPELATLKSHLTDAVQDELGSKTIRRLLITEVNHREL
jgi:flagellar basal body-associated protein FliL